MEDLVIYQGSRYLNIAPRKRYVVELGYIDWNTVRADVWDFNHTFIFETSIEPYDKDEDDGPGCIYGINEEFYADLMETLETNVCGFWNEPEIIELYPKFY
jgi:hypothetical protein